MSVNLVLGCANISNSLNQNGSELAIELDKYLNGMPLALCGQDLPWPNFEAKILKSTVNSVIVEWTHHENALVYTIEKFQRNRIWQQLEWSSSCSVTINLEENFVYRLRIKALRLTEDKSHYITLSISPEIKACTIAAHPSTNCLSRAIKKGQQFLVKRMLRRRPSLIEYPASNGFLPLANAIIQGEMCIIDILLSAGCNVHLGNLDNGRTPLHLSFYYGHLPSARILLNKKALLEAVDSNGMTPAHCAVDANQIAMVQFAIESGANLETRDACGWTLLMRAGERVIPNDNFLLFMVAVVMDASLDLIKLLVTHGADLAALDGVGNSCIDLAKLYRRKDEVDYFDRVLQFRLEKANNPAVT
ncbi:hypothetical protein KR018_006289 [Drosophila ironensis]|nr:hypothetical protein KR018_006289 [Drosophila ironensis]